jgi:hypothetical protein
MNLATSQAASLDYLVVPPGYGIVAIVAVAFVVLVVGLGMLRTPPRKPGT